MRVVGVVIEDIFGWDQAEQRPVKGGGLFGVVRAFTVSAETQVSGDLHAHMVVWLHGMPSTASEMESALGLPSFRSRFIALVDTVTTASVPLLGGNCPRNECGGALQTSDFPLSAYQRSSKRGTAAPVTSSCAKCNATFGSYDLIDTALHGDQALTPSQLDYLTCSDPTMDDGVEALDTPERSPNHFSARPDYARRLAAILRSVQVHYWHHTSSCFKITKKTPTAAVCRFLRPAKAHPNQTIIDSTYDIVLQRPIGCEYLNPYNNALALLFRCNHDARFVVTSTSRDVAAYICKYVMKPQNRVENDLAFRLAATEKAVGSVDARHGAASLSPRSRGNKIMASLLYTTTNRQELHATMAALLVLRGSFIWQSHQVSGLNMQALLSTLDNIDSVEAVVSAPASLLQEKVQVSHKYDILHAYWNRPNDLETLSLTETVEQFVVVKDKLRRLPKRQIMSVRGKQLIHIDDCTDPESRNLYFKSLNLLFKPHRRGTLLVPGLSHEDSYAQFIQGPPTNATAIAKAYEANLRDSYLAAATPEKKSPEEIILSTHSVFAGLTDDNDHGWSYDSDDDGELQESNDMTILPDFVTHSRLSASNELIARDALLEAAIVQSASTIQEQPFGMHDSTSVDALTNTVAESDGASGTSDFLRHCQTIQTRVERLNECFGPVPWRDPSTTMVLDKSDLPRFPSVATVSLAFKLNFWQHAAFESIARHVLYSYREDIERESGCLFERPTHSDLRTQLVGFLGGEAGTGKSTVIHALLTFAERWGRAGSIETLAFTGVAAINVHGRTLHSARNLSTHSLDAPAPSSEMKQNFSKVVLTIIDEISMTDQSLLGRADAVTRQMSANQDRVWGGRHLLYGGDWFQIPPVGGTTAFKPPEANTKHFAGQGFTAYKSINFVVFLTDNMRARHDSVYTSLMARMRWGALTLDDIAILNTRVGADASNPSTTLPFKPVVVGTNELRCAVNLRAQLEAARTGLVQLYESLAVVPPSSEERLRKFRDFDDHLTGRISLRLLYYIGMPVMITKRVTNPLFKTVFANGTIGHIIGHALQSSSYRQQNVEDVSILRHNQMPKHLIIRVKDCNVLLQDGYPPGVFALPPLRDRVTITIPRPQSSSRPDKRKSSDPTMTVVQFPVVPAFACTPEKLQGQTCHDGVVIAALERGGRPASAEGRYVAFSRTVSLEKLTLTQPISLHDAAAFRPKPSLVAEVTRLLQAIVVPTYATPIIIRDFHEWLRRQSL